MNQTDAILNRSAMMTSLCPEPLSTAAPLQFFRLTTPLSTPRGEASSFCPRDNGHATHLLSSSVFPARPPHELPALGATKAVGLRGARPSTVL